MTLDPTKECAVLIIVSLRGKWFVGVAMSYIFAKIFLPWLINWSRCCLFSDKPPNTAAVHDKGLCAGRNWQTEDLGRLDCVAVEFDRKLKKSSGPPAEAARSETDKAKSKVKRKSIVAQIDLPENEE